jgi:2-polyprenyl-3-methyl-5-hydroxy-6-metoxy-1,4-benzoquinol methylase
MTSKLTNCPLCGSDRVRPRTDSLRDSDTIGVAECADCGHVFLDSFDHINDVYFEENQFLRSKNDVADTIDRRLRHFEAENRNRYERVAPLVANKRVIEIGTGAGALIDMIAPLAERIVGIERTVAFRDRLTSKGYDIRGDLSECPDDVDVVLSFHVLEHVADPVGMLRESYAKLVPGGLIYLEVPNIDDALLSLYEIEAYRRFYFFKDHLHYFSRRTLEDAFRAAGLPRPRITGHNRFGLGNHLHWLKTGKPGGHVEWSFLEAASEAYAGVLAANDLSDSLVAHVRKPRT